MEKSKKKRRKDHSSTRNDDDGSDIIEPENMPISFSTKDYAFKGTSALLPMVIKHQINNFSVPRVFINTGSEANILYMSAFLKMRLSESMLQPCDAFLKDVLGKGGNAKMIK
ncbi:hypothetical protein MtrunA17_Chr5g0402231 [Medicago truncatula]|uniref:Uncharacterized protein n=2 Tax=Medicago truncatula TaxID=3880 RepID=A0A396HN84_MEDTR|nr:hypothetical protein MtrunA17_Chr5g0402231 [Medicago truncatula]